MNDLKKQLQAATAQFLRYRVPLFLLLVVVVYGFVAWRAQTFKDAQPDAAAVEAQITTTNSPHVDPATVSKIKQLHDNSVNVRALFDQARKNPFQE